MEEDIRSEDPPNTGGSSVSSFSDKTETADVTIDNIFSYTGFIKMRLSKKLFPWIILMLVSALLVNVTAINGRTMPEGSGETAAPEFPAGMEWLNTDQPLQLRELRGKIVLLDFWTYCCINCIHILPDLKRLEQKYEEELVVIGVHSAKFTTERGTANIRQAILRYNITHPVVNDKNLRIWKKYNARAWPTLVLIDPEGNVAGRHAGEGIYKPFNRAIQKLINEHGNRIDRTPMDFTLERETTARTFLNFPGKITADETRDELYITDSNNHRIVVTDLNGNLKTIIGSGNKGSNDGSFGEVEFNQPQGTVRIGNHLYIADTENHLIRRADLKDRTVETIAGVGRQVYQRNPTGPARKTGLNSPWDLTAVDSTLYIAMAGQHQLWRLDLRTSRIMNHAGSGREDIRDGLLAEAQLAQPSGITTDGERLYFADSEVSGVRMADSDPNGHVSTLIGHGLFEYGDRDGAFGNAMLQHPLGITYANGMLYIADTYNNKIKQLDLEQSRIETIAGTGDPGMSDGPGAESTFDEPGGIDIANGHLYISDTNNHLVRVMDLSSGQVKTLPIRGMGAMSSTGSSARTLTKPESPEILRPVSLGALEQMQFEFELPEGFKINPLARSFIRIYSEDGTNTNTVEITSINPSVPLRFESQPDTLYTEIVLYYCEEENEGLCYIEDVAYSIPNNPGAIADKMFRIRHTVRHAGGGG